MRIAQQQKDALHSVKKRRQIYTMATYRITAWVMIVLFSAAVSVTSASSPSQLAPLRSKRQAVCADGNYTHEGRTCCMCGAGQRLEKHCTTNPDDRVCQYCGPDTYISHPSYKETCEPCTSCSQPNANMEVAEECTVAKDRKCRCKKGFYCSTEICVICRQCKTCDTGVKEACTATSDTVCIDEGPNDSGKIIGAIFGIIIIIAVVACVLYLWWKKNQSQRQPPVETADPLLPHLKGVDLQPIRSDLAQILGWKTMKNIAMRSGIKDTVIESCQLNHQGDAEEQTLELLSKWVEKQGRDAAENLIDALKNSKENMKAEQVRKILSDRLNDQV